MSTVTSTLGRSWKFFAIMGFKSGLAALVIMIITVITVLWVMPRSMPEATPDIVLAGLRIVLILAILHPILAVIVFLGWWFDWDIRQNKGLLIKLFLILLAAGLFFPYLFRERFDILLWLTTWLILWYGMTRKKEMFP